MTQQSRPYQILKPKVIAAIPCYRTELYVGDVVSRAKKYVDQVIVVDDGSDDGTGEVAREAGALVIRHEKNRGYGEAIKSCFEAARSNGADILVTLDPKPGRNFSSINDVQYIIPDAVIEKVGNEYIVIMNDSISPKLSINPYYRALLTSEDKESSICKFLSNRLDSALWLIKSIEQRRITLQKVIESIVRVQREFFDNGLIYLKPLTMREIADMVGVHESTVSRAISGKYVQTPRGVFELKFFFQSGLENVNGTMTSAESTKKLIREIIEGEDSYNPLSDQKIADILKQKGISISRRTVAKYREEMGILSSNKRKRY